jgi:hypothetical protein
MAIYYPVSAALVLFANALQNPGSAEAFADIELMGSVISFLNQLMEASEHVDETIRIVSELSRIAGHLVREAGMTKLNSLKRRYEEIGNTDMVSSPPQNTFLSQPVSTEPDDVVVPLSTSSVSDEAPVAQYHDWNLVGGSHFTDLQFPYNSSNVWIEQDLGDFFTDGVSWYI